MPITILSLGDTNMYKYSNCSQRTSGLFRRDREEGKTNKLHNKATYMLYRFVQGSLYGRGNTGTEI